METSASRLPPTFGLRMIPTRAWVLALAALETALAISTGSCVAFDNKLGGFKVADADGARVLVAPDEWSGVVRAAGDLAKDLTAVITTHSSNHLSF